MTDPESRRFAEEVNKKAWELARRITPDVLQVLAHCLHDQRAELVEHNTLPAWRSGRVTIVVGERIGGLWIPADTPHLSVYGAKGAIGERLCQLLNEKTGLGVFNEDKLSGE